MAVYPSSTFGVPYTPPPPYVPPFRGLRHIISRWDPEHEDADADGWVETWDLSDPDGGIYFPLGDVGGMHLPAFEMQTSKSPALSGAQFKGVRTAERPFGWDLMVYKGDRDAGDTSEAFEVFDSAVWDVLGDPEREFRWTVETPAGTRRHLFVRYAGGDHAYGRDPQADGWVLYQPEFVALDPYWYGEPITQAWHQPAQEPFFSDAPGRLFNISRAATTDSAEITNPGKVASWAKLEVDGAMADMTISIADGTLGLPDVPDGSQLVVDTDPRVGSADLDGVEVDASVDPWDPRPIPAGKTVPVTITASGTGSVRATFRPRFYRAW